MTTSTSTYNRAIELFEQNMNGERENPNFKKFKQAMSEHGIHFDNADLISIYEDVTPASCSAISACNSSYCFNSDYAKLIARNVFATICDNLPEIPTSASDIAHNALNSSLHFCNQFNDEYAKREKISRGAAYSDLRDLYDAIGHLVRRTLKQLADEGTLKETPVYTCGKLYIRLYSLA